MRMRFARSSLEAANLPTANANSRNWRQLASNCAQLKAKSANSRLESASRDLTSQNRERVANSASRVSSSRASLRKQRAAHCDEDSREHSFEATHFAVTIRAAIRRLSVRVARLSKARRIISQLIKDKCICVASCFACANSKPGSATQTQTAPNFIEAHLNFNSESLELQTRICALCFVCVRLKPANKVTRNSYELATFAATKLRRLEFKLARIANVPRI